MREVHRSAGPRAIRRGRSFHFWGVFKVTLSVPARTYRGDRRFCLRFRLSLLSLACYARRPFENSNNSNFSPSIYIIYYTFIYNSRNSFEFCYQFSSGAVGYIYVLVHSVSLLQPFAGLLLPVELIVTGRSVSQPADTLLERQSTRRFASPVSVPRNESFAAISPKVTKE